MRAAPNPRTLTGRSGASSHVLRFPPRAFLRFPGCPPGSSPSSAFLWFPFVRRSPVRSLRPLPGSGSPRFPSGFPFPWAIFMLALPRGGSAGVGPRQQGPRSPALPRPPRLDRVIRPHSDGQRLGTLGIPADYALGQARFVSGPMTRRISGSANGLLNLWGTDNTIETRPIAARIHASGPAARQAVAWQLPMATLTFADPGLTGNPTFPRPVIAEFLLDRLTGSYRESHSNYRGRQPGRCPAAGRQ